jgi:hypothetical protein
VPEDLIKIILPVLGGFVGGIISAVLTARSKLRELEKSFRLTQLAKENEERAKNQLQYLNPLRVSTMDLQHRLSIIEERIQREDPLLINTLDELETKIKDPGSDGCGKLTPPSGGPATIRAPRGQGLPAVAFSLPAE